MTKEEEKAFLEMQEKVTDLTQALDVVKERVADLEDEVRYIIRRMGRDR